VRNEKNKNRQPTSVTKPSKPKTDQNQNSPYNISVKVKPTGEENKEKYQLRNILKIFLC